MEDVLAQLNDSQKDAVTSTEGYIRVVAGAGTGKTRALTHRFAYLVNEVGVLPGAILCATFTNRAAAEMKQRIRKLTGDNDGGFVCTFHSFCVSVLQEESNAVGYPKSFLVIDNNDIDAMLQIIYDERGLTLRDMTFGNARDMIEIIKGVERPNYYLDMIDLPLDKLREKYLEAKTSKDIIFYGYLYQEKKCFALDYNDLIYFTLYIFSQHDDIRQKWQERLEYIMVDEFQDIDLPQYRLMEALCGYHNNLFVVGDPDQTIYTWRGADIRFLLDFDRKFPVVKTVMMNDNYRSTPQILDAANALIGHNTNRMKKELAPAAQTEAGCAENAAGSATTAEAAFSAADTRPVYFHAKTTEEEARWIARQVKALLDSGTAPGDIAVLYRAHYVSRSLEEVFTDERVPFTMYSGIPFFDREEIKDALAYLRLVACRDDLSFRRIVNKPRRNIGKTRMKLLEDYAAENGGTLYAALETLADTEDFSGTGARGFLACIEKSTTYAKEHSISDVLTYMMHESGYEKALRTEGSQTRLDNLAELKQSIYEFENTAGEDCPLDYYLAHTALMSSLDAGASKKCVRFMTVHTAKGLEFDHVFIAGMNEAIFPSRKVQDKLAMEEERRLAFVAVTRAKKTLAVTDAEGRNLDGSIRYPSRFIFDMGKTLRHEIELDAAFSREALSAIEADEKSLALVSSVSDFKEGDRVHHAIQGDGTIIGTDLTKKAFVIQFDGIGTPRFISFKAKLEKI
ncbi:MAG: UvrD-helicase domain-containing protein [Treponema sp.]|nr:UvrD-helicase domain-containing protein [Candidatus Treponema caballi]